MSTVWLITGSSRGSGRALAEAVRAEGHTLVAAARRPAQLADLVERRGDQGGAVALTATDERAAGKAITAASLADPAGAFGLVTRGGGCVRATVRPSRDQRPPVSTNPWRWYWPAT